MRYTVALTVMILSIALLSGCHHESDDKPLTLVTPKGYAKPLAIDSALAADSWQKKALMAMVAPSLAEQAEAAAKIKAQGAPKLVAQAKSGKAAARSGRRTSSVKVAKHRKAKAARGRREMIARR